MTNLTLRLGSAVALALAACNVDNPHGSTGGVKWQRHATCERGLVVVASDYQSTNIVIAGLGGETESESFISSGATQPGLALALSGDVDVPRTAPRSGHVVLLDRFGTNVITWLDLATAEVIAQLPVGTGFEANPQDYMEYDANHALVSRFGSNPSPGQEDFDSGGDLLLLDFTKPRIVGHIPLPEEERDLLPRPGGMTMVGDSVVVTLGRLSSDFAKVGTGRFVGISPSERKLLWTVDIEGLKNCGRLAKSPTGNLGAIACSSQFDSVTYRYNPMESDVVLFDLTVTPPRELRRLNLGTALDAGLMPTLEFASESKLLAFAYGGNSTPGDRAVAVDIDSGTHELLVEVPSPYTLGGAHCAPGCGDVCVVSDSGAGLLHRFQLSEAGVFTALAAVEPEHVIGLPPLRIGAL